VAASNVELVQRAFEAFSERDLDAALAVMHPDVEFLPVTANLTTGGMPYRGHAGLAKYMEDIGRVWDELRIYPREFRENGDCVVALGRIHGRGGGMIIDRPTGWVWKMRDGKIAWIRVFTSHEEALGAAGLG
jgi:ketosteroid isomerase-like protein